MRDEGANISINTKDNSYNANTGSRIITRSQTSEERQHKILVVDDENDIALVYKTVLEEAGFYVNVFNDPLAALSKVKEIYALSSTQKVERKRTKSYDLLLLDIKMPMMSGFELYREIKKIFEENEQGIVKVCFITAYEIYYEQLKEEFPKIDVACFIKKPIDGNDLVKRIKQELLMA
jgi:two-component system, OmpR family, response regulator ChvI